MRKLGPHIIEGASVAIGKPTVVKLFNASVAYVRQVREQVGPGVLIVVRWYEPTQPLDDPRRRANEWMTRRESEMRAMTNYGRDLQVAFEGYNEIGDAQATPYCAFELERLEFMHAKGLRAVVGNWSVGVPDLPMWATYQPVLDKMEPGDLVGLHEYWAETADIENPWYCARWQLVPQLRGRPIVITECGRDEL